VVGDALRYQDANGTELPAGMWVAMREESVFDVASLTKLFTATVLMTLVEEGLLALDAPIAEHLPSFASGIAGRSRCDASSATRRASPICSGCGPTGRI